MRRSCGLFSTCVFFPDDELSIKNAIQQRFRNLSVSLSSDITAIEREYERACSTVINAYIQPLVSSYIGEVNASLPLKTPFHVMTSSGDSSPIVKLKIPNRNGSFWTGWWGDWRPSGRSPTWIPQPIEL